MVLPRTIYAIQHNVTKRIYIGSSADVEKRYMHHIWLLRAGKHTVEDMQDDFIKYGEDFSLFELEEITEYKDRFKEYEWMEKYNSYRRGIGYNYNDPVFTRTAKRTKIPRKEGLPEPLA